MTLKFLLICLLLVGCSPATDSNFASPTTESNPTNASITTCKQELEEAGGSSALTEREIYTLVVRCDPQELQSLLLPSETDRLAAMQALRSLVVDDEIISNTNHRCQLFSAKALVVNATSQDMSSARENCPDNVDLRLGELSPQLASIAEKTEESAARERALARAAGDADRETRNLRRNSKWTSHIDTSQMTDEKSVYLINLATVDNNDVLSSTARLTIRCRENTTSAIWSFDDYLGDDYSDVYSDDKRLMIRVDDNPPKTYRLSVSTDNDSVGMWSGGQAIPFIKSIATANKIVTRITPYNSAPRESVFDISGLDLFLPELREACHW